MQYHSISYSVKAIVTFTYEEIGILIACSEGHYDHACRALSQPMGPTGTGKQGLLIGLRNVMTNFKEDYPHVLAFRELDTMAKCLEMAYLHPEWRDSERDKGTWHTTASRLSFQLAGILNHLNESYIPDIGIPNPHPPYTPIICKQTDSGTARCAVAPAQGEGEACPAG